jgi:DegV family protein with EDD domain
MQQSSVYDEGYDSLDVNTRAAMAYVETHKPRASAARLAQLAEERSPEAARTLIVVDAACDLPQVWLDQNAVVVMPRIVRIGNREMIETRDANEAMSLVQHLAKGGDAPSQSIPFTPVAMRNEMQQWINATTDSVLQLCFSARRSRVYMNALAATQSLVLIHNKVRRLAGTRTPLTAWVIDSANALGGIGVALSHAIRLRDSGTPSATIAVTLNTFRNTVHTLVAPHDLAFVARSAKTFEQQGIPAWKMSLGTMLDFKPILQFNADRARAIHRVRGHQAAMRYVLANATQMLKQGALGTPFIVASYSGRLDEVEALEEYKQLRTLCARHQVVCSLTTMSMTGALMLGPRALAVSFASQQFKP